MATQNEDIILHNSLSTTQARTWLGQDEHHPHSDAPDTPISETDGVTIEALTHQLCAAGNRRERFNAAWALRRIGQPAMGALLAGLREGDEETQMLAAMALANTGRAAVEYLIDMLQNAPDAVRQKTIWVLWKIGDLRAVDPLIAALHDDPNAKTRRYAAWALGQLRDDRAIPDLIRALGDENDRVRVDAAIALERMGQRAVEPLLQALFTGSANVRIGAAKSLAWLQDTGAVDLLIAALKDDDAEVRVYAAYALGWIDDVRAVMPLVEALYDEAAEVRAQAAASLGWLGDERAVEPLLHVLDDENALLTYAAVEALGNLGDVRAIAPLVLAYQEDAGKVRYAARDALRKLRYTYL